MYIYTEEKAANNGSVTFTPLINGIPLFSSIAFASASGISNTLSAASSVLTGISSIASDATSITFNCVGSTGILLGGVSLAAIDAKPIKCFILGKENPAALPLMQGKLDGVFYKV